MSESRDLVVVGAGPAGMAAAATAPDGGLRASTRAPAPGGQFWRHPALFARETLPTADLHHGLSTYRALCSTSPLTSAPDGSRCC
ncbi:FAD-dependent oxidoreductase OS=Streptomyces microflavus OX=1919 GN=HUT09_35610 PE=4 SV=1 [Streptomyces microflavus]